MPIDLYLSFVLASALLILMPGPMVALIITNGVVHGARSGFITVAGAAAAMAVHLSVVCLGLAALMAALGEAAFWLKWGGAAYLLYLGLSALLSKAPLFDEARVSPKSARRTFAEAFLVQLTNPKLLMFYAAFFPLFVSPDLPIVRQLLIMSGTFLAIEIVLDLMWAALADKARPFLRSSGRWGNRVAGAVLIAAAISLGALGQS